MTTATALAARTRTDIQSALDAYWTGRAGNYHAHQTTGLRAQFDRDLWAAVAARALAPVAAATTGPLNVLDVGTGSGYLAWLLADLGHRVTGIDTADGMLIAAAAAHPADPAAHFPGWRAPRFRRGDAHTLPTDLAHSGTFDAVVSRYVLWTLPDPVAALTAWADALTPGGIIAAIDATWYPNGINPDLQVPSADGPDAFVNTYLPHLSDLPLATAETPDAYVDAFHAAGLTNVTCTPLPQVAHLDRLFGVAPGHESRPHFVITGAK
jgi:SAM-dependent methyltransferase